MKYSNGFFLYQLLKDNRENQENNRTFFHFNVNWVPYKHIDSFSCYYFYILDHGFHEVPVWFNFDQHYAVIFLINYSLIPDVIEGIQNNFAYRCESFLSLNSHNISDFNIIPEAGFIVTNLLKTDKDRIATIYEVVGEDINAY